MKKLLSIIAMSILFGAYAEEIKDFKTLEESLENGTAIRLLLTFQKTDSPDSKIVTGFKSNKFIRYYGSNLFDQKEGILLHEESNYHGDKVESVYMTIFFYTDDLAKVDLRILHIDKTVELWTFIEKMGNNIKVFSEE